MAENKTTTGFQIFIGVIVTLVVLAGLTVLGIWIFNPDYFKRNNFPESPTIGQRFEKNGVTYEWNGTAWVVVGQPPPIETQKPQIIIVPQTTQTYVLRNQPPNTICFNRNDMEECSATISYRGCSYELISSSETFCCYKKTNC